MPTTWEAMKAEAISEQIPAPVMIDGYCDDLAMQEIEDQMWEQLYGNA